MGGHTAGNRMGIVLLALAVVWCSGGVWATASLEQWEVVVDANDYVKPDQESIRAMLSPLQYTVTQEDGTEPPFANKYWNNDEPGLYVDIVTGEPLFSSKDKFVSWSGWPSFTQPIVPDVVSYQEDRSHGMVRREVRSRVGDSHLGHVFADGPRDRGGLRYCINSAALRFIPLADMDEAGYGWLRNLVAERSYLRCNTFMVIPQCCIYSGETTLITDDHVTSQAPM